MAKYEPKILLKLRTLGRGKSRVELRLVQWPGSEPQLESRQFITGDAGEEVIGRIRGLTYDDLCAVVNCWSAIKVFWPQGKN